MLHQCWGDGQTVSPSSQPSLLHSAHAVDDPILFGSWCDIATI
jgi:hypothetical protein